MKISDFRGGDYYIGGDPRQEKKLRLDADRFRMFLDSNWDLTSWEYFDEKRTRLTHYRFDFNVEVEDGIVQITGRINDNEWKRVQLEHDRFRLNRGFPNWE